MLQCESATLQWTSPINNRMDEIKMNARKQSRLFTTIPRRSGGTVLLLFFLGVLSNTTNTHARSNEGISPQAGGSQAAAQQPGQPTEGDALVQEAYNLYQAGKFEEAREKCAKAVAINQNDFRAHAIAGIAWMAQWKMKSASAEFATVIKLQPQRKEFYVLKAKADISLGNVDGAIGGCHKALELDPNFADAYATIGEALEHNEKRQTEAIAAYQAALKINPKLFPAYDSLGQLYVNIKDEKTAEHIYRQGIAEDPAHMAGRFQLGRLLV